MVLPALRLGRLLIVDGGIERVDISVHVIRQEVVVDELRVVGRRLHHPVISDSLVIMIHLSQVVELVVELVAVAVSARRVHGHGQGVQVKVVGVVVQALPGEGLTFLVAAVDDDDDDGQGYEHDEQ